jgi:hypothetical protein
MIISKGETMKPPSLGIVAAALFAFSEIGPPPAQAADSAPATEWPAQADLQKAHTTVKDQMDAVGRVIEALHKKLELPVKLSAFRDGETKPYSVYDGQCHIEEWLIFDDRCDSTVNIGAGFKNDAVIYGLHYQSPYEDAWDSSVPTQEQLAKETYDSRDAFLDALALYLCRVFPDQAAGINGVIAEFKGPTSSNSASTATPAPVR